MNILARRVGGNKGGEVPWTRHLEFVEVGGGGNELLDHMIPPAFHLSNHTQEK